MTNQKEREEEALNKSKNESRTGLLTRSCIHIHVQKPSLTMNF